MTFQETIALRPRKALASAWVLALGLGVSGCASSAKIQDAQAATEKALEALGESKIQARNLQAKFSAAEAARTKAEGQAADLAAKLKASQARIDALTKSNKDLGSTIQAKKGELGAKVKELVAEKDELSRRLAEVQKEKIQTDRALADAKAKAEAGAKEIEAARREMDQLASERDAVRAERDTTLTERDAARGEWKAALAERDVYQGQLSEKAAEEDSARAARQAREEGARREADILLRLLASEAKAGQARVTPRGDAVEIVLREPLLFEPQKAQVTDKGKTLLDRLAPALKASARALRVEGHTDDTPIKWELFGGFKGHWELTSARAVAVAQYLQEKGAVDPKGLTASGFGESRPAEPNTTPGGKTANRRVALVLEPMAGPR